MKKIIVIHFLFFASIGLLLAQKQKSQVPVQITKAELLSFGDIKPLIAIAFPGRDYTNYTVHSFNLSCSATEGGNLITFIENNRCDKLTEKQLSLIEKYGKNGMVFTLEEILMIEHGKPGIPYNPAEEIVFSVPDFLVTIKE